MFDDALYIAHRLARRKDFGNQRTRDRRSIHFKKTDALPELIVRLAGRWSRAPDRHGMTVILKNRPPRIADERGNREQFENALGCTQHRTQKRRNWTRDRVARLPGINHRTPPRAPTDSPDPAATISLNTDLSMALLEPADGRQDRLELPVRTRFLRPDRQPCPRSNGR